MTKPFSRIVSLVCAGTIVLLVMSLVASSAAEGKESWESPTGDFRVVKRSGESEGEKELWVVSTRTPEKQSLLFRYNRSGDVIISPDETCIAFNYHYSSTDSTVVLFRRSTGVSFEAIKNLDLGDLVKDFYRKTAQKAMSIDHWYVDCLAWSRDSKAVLLKAYGHGKEENLPGWFCVYSLLGNQMSLNLKAMNL